MPALINTIGENNRIESQIANFPCPRCTQDLRMTGLYSGSETDDPSRRRVEGVYTCDCGYQVTIVESYPIFSTEAPHEPFMRQEQPS